MYYFLNKLYVYLCILICILLGCVCQPSFAQQIGAPISIDSTVDGVAGVPTNLIDPIIPNQDSSRNSLTNKKEELPFWALPPLDTLRNRMQEAGDITVDNIPFKMFIIRYDKAFYRYRIWMNEAHMFIRYQYKKNCSKRAITKDCFWKEINIPYKFIDSIRENTYGAGYFIHYKNLLVKNAKFKILVGRGEINLIAKTIRKQMQAFGIALDSQFANTYKQTWQARVKLMLQTLNKKSTPKQKLLSKKKSKRKSKLPRGKKKDKLPSSKKDRPESSYRQTREELEAAQAERLSAKPKGKLKRKSRPSSKTIRKPLSRREQLNKRKKKVPPTIKKRPATKKQPKTKKKNSKTNPSSRKRGETIELLQ